MPARRPSPLPADIQSELAAIYAEAERIALPRDCQLRATCCRFRQTGKTPLVTQAEALYAAKGVRAAGKTAIKPHPGGDCPLLGPLGRCTIYQHRPFGCRTHFCEAAGGPYPRKHVAALVHRLEALDERLGHHDGSRPFEKALADALGDFD